ncbi:uncharacterized protein Bfra_006362 [Botrytis fragariae]|uniref:Uncharacterized protein n=1 Tax=Botrytis fragariae TaxID=1964551 RepID=A0A8H6B4A1_9HELO|nr:uncharacterized protein Bfra_006362 [Botrytis fragariae]KAF5879158.1 hypothetical protein Bfra_006362 [Botrytis fragariae]
MATHPSLPSLDFGEIDITPPSLRRQSRPYSKPISHESEAIPQLPSSFSDASSLLDSSSRTSDIAIKSISSRSQAKVHDIRYCLMEYYVDWKWEFLASLIVIACPFVIIMTLYPNAGKPLPEWPFQISINTLLSIYGLVFKTCLTFIVTSCIGQLQWFWFSSRRPLYDAVCYDRATRGPWGSIQLLCSEHIRNPLTGLCAIILIAAVAIDPLIQQLVLPYDCEVLTLNIEATLPRTNQFDNVDSILIDPTSELPIKSAIYAPENWMTWQCITGNCTFSDTYGTLAYCSSCEDASDKLIFETTCYDEEANINVTSTTGYCAGALGSFATTKFFAGDYPPDEDDPFTGQWVNTTISFVSTPESYQPNNPLAISVILGHPNRPGERVYIIVPRTVDPSKRLDPESMGPWIDRNMTITSNPWRLQGHGAAVCSLQPCIRTYNANINGTRLTEHSISSSSTHPWGFSLESHDDIGEYWIGMIDTHCISEGEREALSTQGYKIESSSQWLAFTRSFLPSQVEYDLVSSLLSHRCLYMMAHMIMRGIPFITDLLGDNLHGYVSSLEPGMSIDGGINRTTAFGGLVGPRMMLDLYDNGYIEFEDVQETFSNISDIITAWIRTHGNSNFSDPAVGKVLHYATCLRVQWPWIAFPATLAILSLVCFVAVVVVMDRQQVPVWKSSPLALIMRGSNKEFWCKPTADAMEERSKDITVILMKGSDPQIQVVRKDFGLVDIVNRGGNNSTRTLNDDARE